MPTRSRARFSTSIRVQACRESRSWVELRKGRASTRTATPAAPNELGTGLIRRLRGGARVSSRESPRWGSLRRIGAHRCGLRRVAPSRRSCWYVPRAWILERGFKKNQRMSKSAPVPLPEQSDATKMIEPRPGWFMWTIAQSAAMAAMQARVRPGKRQSK